MRVARAIGWAYQGDKGFTAYPGSIEREACIFVGNPDFSVSSGRNLFNVVVPENRLPSMESTHFRIVPLNVNSMEFNRAVQRVCNSLNGTYQR